jgi:hypothetical protein
MYDEDWLNLLENLDNIHLETYTLNRKDIEAIQAIDLELMKRDEELEAIQIALDESEE